MSTTPTTASVARPCEEPGCAFPRAAGERFDCAACGMVLCEHCDIGHDHADAEAQGRLNGIQLLTGCPTEGDAEQVAEWLATQVGLIGLRVLSPTGKDPTWRVQAFFDADGVQAGDWLPDGCTYVILPASLTWARRICTRVSTA